MTVKKTKHEQTPRVGRDGRYKSIYSAEFETVDVSFADQTGGEIDTMRESLDAIHQQDTLTAIKKHCGQFLAKQGLPSRDEVVTVDTDTGQWRYGKNCDDIAPGPSFQTINKAVETLGHEPRTATWHAANAVFWAGRAQDRIADNDADSAAHGALQAAWCYQAFLVQSAGFDECARSGAKSYASKGKPPNWLRQHAHELKQELKRINKRSKPAAQARREAAELLADRYGYDPATIPADRTLRSPPFK